MIIGIPKEIKEGERRVSLAPEAVQRLTAMGHELLVEQGAGAGCHWPDSLYRDAGAKILGSKEDLYARAELIVKVKEPLPPEWVLFRQGQIIFSFLHLAANLELARRLREAGVSALACETVRYQGRLVLLEPMSRIAGRMAPIVGSFFLGAPQGGCGRLVGGLPGTFKEKVVVLGGGTAGRESARTAIALGASVSVLEVDPLRVASLEADLPGGEILLFSPDTLHRALEAACLVISTVHVPGTRAPRILGPKELSRLQAGAVFVDLAIDQGGSSETSRPTTHQNPVYEACGVLHYCVANMPAAYPRTAAETFSPILFRYVERIAQMGLERAVEADPGLREGLQVHQGKILLPALAQALSA
jgi:alanine dehydrogenase